jgi:hypothetical protein
MVARTEGYTYAATVWDLSLVQGPLSHPTPNPNRPIRNLRIAAPQVPKSNATQYTVTEAYFTALLDHVNIVEHHETFVHDGQLIVAMELCEVRRPRSRLSPPPRVRSLCPLVLSTYPVTPKTTHVHGGRGCG